MIANWLLILGLFIVVLFLAIGIGYYYRNIRTPTPAPPGTIPNVVGWGPNTAGPDTERNTCQLYTFPGILIDGPGIETAAAGVPTFNTTVINGLKGTTGLPVCLYSDQILARQVQHTCISPEGLSTPAINRCLLRTGGTTGIGGTEVYYTDQGCLKLEPCPGSIATVSLNFQAPSDQELFCLERGPNDLIIMDLCDPIDVNQQFEITRINPGQDPRSLKPNEGQNGLVAQLKHRATGRCVVPGSQQLTTFFRQDSVPGCTGGSGVSISGQEFRLEECRGGTYPGYEWIFLPPIANDNNGFITTSPPQLVYVNNLQQQDLINVLEGYRGQTGLNALLEWLTDPQAPFGTRGASAWYSGSDILNENYRAPIVQQVNRGALNAQPVARCFPDSLKSQYLNITTFNIISELQVCFAEGQVECVPL